MIVFGLSGPGCLTRMHVYNVLNGTSCFCLQFLSVSLHIHILLRFVGFFFFLLSLLFCRRWKLERCCVASVPTRFVLEEAAKNQNRLSGSRLISQLSFAAFVFLLGFSPPLLPPHSVFPVKLLLINLPWNAQPKDFCFCHFAVGTNRPSIVRVLVCALNRCAETLIMRIKTEYVESHILSPHLLWHRLDTSPVLRRSFAPLLFSAGDCFLHPVDSFWPFDFVALQQTVVSQANVCVRFSQLGRKFPNWCHGVADSL